MKVNYLKRFGDIDLPYCTALYTVTFVKNYAGAVGGAMYVSLHVDTDSETEEISREDCFKFDNIKFIDNTAVVAGD